MQRIVFGYVLRPQAMLLFLFLLVFSFHLEQGGQYLQYLVPEPLYQYELTMSFDPEADLEVSTYLPLENKRQEILQEDIEARNMDLLEHADIDGRYATWRGDVTSRQIKYSSLLALRPLKFDIVENVEIPRQYPDGLKKYLAETSGVQIDHPEIHALWKQIKPLGLSSLSQIVRAIYDYTYKNISILPFKGFTDSLTTLRLGSASCNGKSRLFLSLARLNNIPSRLVGGVILSGNKKKTSHQWVEVYVEGHWVPFDPTNGHYASLPGRYVELYRGDKSLFKHTSNINFDYYFESFKRKISPALYRDSEFTNSIIPNAALLLQRLGLDLNTTYIFLLFPFGTLIVAFLRNIIGLRTFGVFMPILIASACIYTGFFNGIAGFIFVLILAVVGHHFFGQYNVLKIPRLAAIITLITIVSLCGITLIDTPAGIGTGILVLFPAVIISFTADRINAMSDEGDWKHIIENFIGTLLTILLCYLMLNSILLQGLFALYPELLLLILSMLLFIGNWSGIRFSELIRFRKILNSDQMGVLGLNSRNINIINKHNDKALLKLATDKIQTKAKLIEHEIACPPTLNICHNLGELSRFIGDLKNYNDFVIKPNKGARGNGILIITDKTDFGFVGKSGRHWTFEKISKHVCEILTGSFSQDGEEDLVYIEPIIQQHEALNEMGAQGLCDIRVILWKGELVNAMLRIPTSSSNGKANLHQGALGSAINMSSGKIERVSLKGVSISQHPEGESTIIGTQIPHWENIKVLAQRCFDAIPLNYMGVDICIDQTLGPLVLEINGRPGLEIQNVHNEGMMPSFSGA